MRRPRDKVDVNKKKTSVLIRSPIQPAAPMLHKPLAPIMPRRSIPLRPPNGERKLLVEAAAAQWKPNIVSIEQITGVKTYQAAAVELHSANAQQLAPLRIQCPDKAGEERWIYNIVNEMNKGLLTPCSPGSQMVPILPISTPLSSPHHLPDKSISATAAKHDVYNTGSKEEERTGIRLPQEAAATLPVHLPIAAIAPHQPLSSVAFKKQAGRKAISRGQTGDISHLPTSPATPELAERAPIPPGRASSHKPKNEETKPQVEEAVTRCMPNITNDK